MPGLRLSSCRPHGSPDREQRRRRRPLPSAPALAGRDGLHALYSKRHAKKAQLFILHSDDSILSRNTPPGCPASFR